MNIIQGYCFGSQIVKLSVLMLKFVLYNLRLKGLCNFFMAQKNYFKI